MSYFDSSNKRSFIMGVLCLPVGLIVGFYFTHEGEPFFYIYAAIAAFLTASFMWWYLLEKKGCISIGQGIFSGALSGLIAHWVCWYIQIIEINVEYRIIGSLKPSIVSIPADPLNGLWVALSLSLGSWLFCGWITVPAGALIGGAYAFYLTRIIASAK